MIDYFKDDEYWKVHIDKEIEDDMWIDEYDIFKDIHGKCLDLGCGIGQYSKRLMEYGFDVTSADISKTALERVREFNDNCIELDMREPLPFNDKTFDLVFASLSIHYYDEETTNKLLNEVKRILKDGGVFIGSVNGTEGFEKIKDTATTLGHHYYLNKNKYIRLFDFADLDNFLSIFDIIRIDKREVIRFEHQKNYYVFIVRKV